MSDSHIKTLATRSMNLIEKTGDFTCNSSIQNSSLINSVPHDKFSDWSKLKVFTDNKISVT